MTCTHTWPAAVRHKLCTFVPLASSACTQKCMGKTASSLTTHISNKPRVPPRLNYCISCTACAVGLCVRTCVCVFQKQFLTQILSYSSSLCLSNAGRMMSKKVKTLSVVCSLQDFPLLAFCFPLHWFKLSLKIQRAKKNVVKWN